MDKWNPSKADVLSLCEAITERFIDQDSNTGGDYCIHCGKMYGNADNYKVLPHERWCPVLIAQDVMTGIEA